MIWARMLAYITGTVDQELLLRNEYLAAENRILRAQIKGRMLLSDAEKATLAEIAHRLGRKALEELAAVAKPDTLLAWYRKLIATKFDGSKFRKSWVVPEWTRKPSGWWCGWRKKIPGGAMTGSWAPWPTRVSRSRIRRWATSCVGTESLPPPNENTPPAGKILSMLTWRYWWRPTSSRWKCLR